MLEEVGSRGIGESVLSYLLFLGVGICLTIAGPLLPQLQELTYANVSQISWFGTLRSGAYAVGSLVGATPLGRRLGLHRVLQGSGMLIALLTWFLPWSRHLAVLLLIGAGQGFTAGIIELVAIQQIRRFWERTNLALMLQLMTASYMIGSFVAPFIVVPFLPTPRQQNTTMVRYVLNTSDANATETTPDPLLVPGIDTRLVMLEFTTWNYMNTICTIIAVFLFVTSLAYVMFTIFSKMADDDPTSTEQLIEDDQYEQSPCYSNSVLTIGIAANALYGGIMMTFGGIFLVEYVMSNGIAQAQGAIAVTLFWGAGTFGSLLTLGVLKLVGPSKAIGAYATALLCGSIILVTCRGNVILIQVASFILGFGCSIFPQGSLAWVIETVGVTRVGTGLLMTASPIGQMAMQALVGAFFQHTPMTLPYAVCASASLILLLQVAGNVLKVAGHFLKGRKEYSL